jgi:dATP pyrophosphohydrolase
MSIKVKPSIECWILSDNSEPSVLLLCVKGKEGSHPDFYQPITGGIKNEESPIEACVREIFEETGLKIEGSHLSLIKENFVVDINPNLKINKTIYSLRVPSFVPKLNPREHIGYKWINVQNVSETLFYESNKQTWIFIRE